MPVTPLAAATRAAENLRRAVDDFRFHHEGKEGPVTLSVGAAELREADTIESALERADRALYRAKSTGRNRCVSEDGLTHDLD